MQVKAYVIDKEKEMNKRTKKGFTLIELIVVIAILALLAVIAIPLVSSLVTDAEKVAAEANARTLELAIKAELTSGDIDIPVLSTDLSTDFYKDYGLTADKLTNNGKFALEVDHETGSVSGTVGTGGISVTTD